MKVLILKVGEKTYTTGKITTYLSREALKIQKLALALAVKGQEIQQENAEENLEKVNELLDEMLELKDRKTWLICEIYSNKFTADELEKYLDDEEIDIEINRIISGVQGIVTKN